MPHFIIEHGNALHSENDRHNALQIAADCGATCGFITPRDIKVRLIPFTDFLALDGRHSFVHITIRLLAGRTAAQKSRLAETLRDAFDKAYPDVESISIETVDMDAATYKKRLNTRP